MGAVLAALIRGPLGTRHGIRQIIWCSFAISFVLLAAGAPFGIFWGRTFLGVTVRPTAINLFFTAIIATALRVGTSPWKAIVNPRPLRFLGDISYCIYLVHMLMFELVNHILIRLIPSLPSGKGHFGVMVLRFSLATSITILIAVLSRRYFEGPFLRLRHTLRRRPISRKTKCRAQSSGYRTQEKTYKTHWKLLNRSCLSCFFPSWREIRWRRMIRFKKREPSQFITIALIQC